MADRSPSKPRRSLTPDISLPPSSAAEASAAFGIADEGKIRTSEDLKQQEDANPTKQQPSQQQLSPQPSSPGSPSHHSPGGAGGANAPAAEDAVDRSPSKPKRATSPVPPANNPPLRPPFHRGGSLRLSLREEPEPRFGPMPMLLPRQAPPSIGSATLAAASDLHPLCTSSQLSVGQSQGQSQSQQASFAYAHSHQHQQWQMSSSLRMDDDSTQTWNNNEESTTTFAYSLLDAPPTYTFGGSGGRTPPTTTARRDGSQRRPRPPSSSSRQGGADGAGESAVAASDAAAAPEEVGSARTERISPNEEDLDDDDERGGAGAVAGAVAAGAAAVDTDSPESSGEHSPTSASLSLTSLMGAPMAAEANPATTPTGRVLQQHRRGRGNGNGRGGGGAAAATTTSASLASSVSSSLNFRPALTMEVAPGVSRPLWHSDTTRRAVADGQARECVCQGCHNALFSVRHAAYVLCPVCSTVSDLLVGGENTDEAHESAICVGVKRDDAAPPPSSPRT